MSELQKLKLVIGYEFLKHIRRKRLYVILGLTLVTELAVLILLPVLGDYPNNVNVMAAILTIGPSLAVIGAVFFAGDAIAGEFENKTGYMLFTNPIRRITLLTGKYLASLVSVGLLVIFGYLITVFSLLAIYGTLPGEILKSFGLCLLYAASVISVTFFFSSLSKGAMGAVVITMVFVMVISGIIESVLMMAGEPYWFMLSAGGDSIALVYGRLEQFMEGITPEGGGGRFPFSAEPLNIGLAALAMAAYLIVGFALSVWLASRRQLA